MNRQSHHCMKYLLVKHTVPGQSAHTNPKFIIVPYENHMHSFSYHQNMCVTPSHHGNIMAVIAPPYHPGHPAPAHPDGPLPGQSTHHNMAQSAQQQLLGQAAD